ncbi:MAG: hypothetical protein NTZ35_07370 [Ignavibacteriales bacterium]|nr:hypothetical protein [Ignavibacteriales bacterium]
MKNIFPQQTRDAVEMLFHDLILVEFGSYKDFWEEFIGVQIKGGFLKPYGLKHAQLSPPQSNFADTIYERICMAHYGIFCQLASVHNLVVELDETKKIVDEKERHCAHWQKFECAYLCLGAAWQEVKKLWELVIFNLENLDDTKEKREAIGDFFRRRGTGPNTLHAQLQTMQDTIIGFRNEIAHVSRYASRANGKTYEIPLNYRPKLTWTQQHSATSWVSTTSRLQTDLSNVEKLFQLVHRILIGELRRVFAKYQINIDYASGEQDTFCSQCGWWLDFNNNTLNASTGPFNMSPALAGQTLASSSLPSQATTPPNPSPLGSGIINVTNYPQIPVAAGKCANPRCPGNMQPIAVQKTPSQLSWWRKILRTLRLTTL